MKALKAGGVALAAGAAVVAYSLWEARQHTLRRVEVEVLEPGSAPLRVLHISDLHLTPDRISTVRWVRMLAELRPDLVIATGDFLAHPEAVPTVADALDPLFDVPGAFVLGSNDYFAPRLSNPLKYLGGPSEVHPERGDLPTDDLVAELSASWADLSNASAVMRSAGREISLRGVDDPHIQRDDYAAVAGPWAPADLRLGVTHAPYRRVLDAMAGDGADLVLAGHTHGGQLRVPGFGALVTNCDLPRGQARGLSAYGDAALHVSAGLGTSPYAPIRFACPPEATLLSLVARGDR